MRNHWGSVDYFKAPGEGEGWCIHPRERIYANLCGVCIQGDKNTATFTMDIEQYTTSFADLTKQAAEDCQITAYKSIFPSSGHIPDSPRFVRGKPIPHAKKYTAVGGYLVGLSSSLIDEKVIDRFRIEVDTVALGLGSFVLMAISTCFCEHAHEGFLLILWAYICPPLFPPNNK
ncbi:hypothetical protein C8J57DRAFT_1524360 [Mycena rebaudengoi]|nr:hypothetical protein C8J57DRAFT_1524360 [Mycena rebaudengoi]